MAADVKIDIAAEFTGKKAFKQADTATDKLVKSTKKLAGALGLAFGTQAVIAFGKKSVKAFAESELEATRLRTAVTNLGLAFAAPEIDRYIDKIELATGVNRDQLQPSFLNLLRTTGSLAKSQELLNLSLDIAASEGISVTSVSEKLSQAYVGQARGLRSLNLGLTTAELNTADFEFIQRKLTTLFGGQGEAAAASYTAQMAKLAIASEQASEIIGGGLVDSLMILSGNTSVDDLAEDMLDAARNTAAFTKSVVDLSNKITAPIKGLSSLLTRFVQLTSPLVDLIVAGDPSGFMTKKPPAPSSAPAAAFGGKPFYADAEKNAKAIAKAETAAKKRAAELLAIKKKQQALEAKTLKDKKLSLAIDKANIGLLKGEGIFDMEKIQLNAALESQAQALGKAQNAAQVLAITQDVARLNVKKSMLALDDAIASKDEAAIVAATKKLNADLGILGALSGQSIKLSDIKSILDSLKPKDLIDQANLDQALARIRQMLALLASMNGTISTAAIAATARTTPAAAAATAVPPAAAAAVAVAVADTAVAVAEAVAAAASDIIPPVDIRFTDVTAAETAAVVEYAEAATERANAVADATDALVAAGTAILAASSSIATADIGSAATSSIVAGMLGGADFGSAVSGARYAAQAAANYNITINANTVANPEELTNIIQDTIIRINKRGDYLTTAGAL
jgi:hypothetical protein